MVGIDRTPLLPCTILFSKRTVVAPLVFYSRLVWFPPSVHFLQFLGHGSNATAAEGVTGGHQTESSRDAESSGWLSSHDPVVAEKWCHLLLGVADTLSRHRFLFDEDRMTSALKDAKPGPARCSSAVKVLCTWLCSAKVTDTGRLICATCPSQLCTFSHVVVEICHKFQAGPSVCGK